MGEEGWGGEVGDLHRWHPRVGEVVVEMVVVVVVVGLEGGGTAGT